MSIQNIIPFLQNKILVLGFLFCSMGAFNVSGQEESIRVVSESPAGYDKIGDLEGSDLAVIEKKSEEKIKKSNFKPVEKNEQLYIEGGEKVEKKEGMSTLSFNLFLYVADKFKEDN